MMMLLFFDGMPPIVLGFWGTIIMAGGLAISIVLNAYTARWRSTAVAATTELDVYKQRCERLQTERDEQKTTIAKLEAATDLRAVQATLAELAAENARCHAATAQAINEQAAILKEVVAMLERMATLIPIAAAMPTSTGHRRNQAVGKR